MISVIDRDLLRPAGFRLANQLSKSFEFGHLFIEIVNYLQLGPDILFRLFHCSLPPDAIETAPIVRPLNFYRPGLPLEYSLAKEVFRPDAARADAGFFLHAGSVPPASSAETDLQLAVPTLAVPTTGCSKNRLFQQLTVPGIGETSR